MSINGSDALQDLIAAAEAKAAKLRHAAEAEVSKISAKLIAELATLDGYIRGVKDALRVDSEAHPALPPPTNAPETSERRIIRRRKAAKSSKRGRQQAAKAKAPARARPRKATFNFRKGSLPDRVREMVLKSKKPLHLSEVVKQLGGPKKASLQSVENRISALARKGAAFVRTAPRIYGLLEMGHRAAE